MRGSRVTISSIASNPAAAMAPNALSSSHIHRPPVEKHIRGILRLDKLLGRVPSVHYLSDENIELKKPLILEKKDLSFSLPSAEMRASSR